MVDHEKSRFRVLGSRGNTAHRGMKKDEKLYEVIIRIMQDKPGDCIS
jgi:hypothetical protein